jgi:hypothetical protein
MVPKTIEQVLFNVMHQDTNGQNGCTLTGDDYDWKQTRAVNGQQQGQNHTDKQHDGCNTGTSPNFIGGHCV